MSSVKSNSMHPPTYTMKTVSKGERDLQNQNLSSKPPGEAWVFLCFHCMSSVSPFMGWSTLTQKRKLTAHRIMEAEAWPGPILYVSHQVTWKWGHAFVLDEVRSLSSHGITMGLYISMLICFSLFQIRPALQLSMGDKIMLGWIMKLRMT